VRAQTFDFGAVARVLAPRTALLGGGAAPNAEECRLRFAALNKSKKKSSPKAVAAAPTVVTATQQQGAVPPAPPTTNFSGLD